MKQLKNEKGYALLISFVFILLLVIFVSSFAIRSTNNYKQIEQTDDTYELTSIAEMGVEYYLAAVTNKIAMYQDPTTSEGQYLQNKIKQINSYIVSENANKKTPSQSVIDSYINDAMNTLINDIEDLLEIKCSHESFTESQLKTNAVCVKEPTGANFEILKSVKDNDRTWTISVVGKLPTTKKTSEIVATYNIPSDFTLIRLDQQGASESSSSPIINITFSSLLGKSLPSTNFVENLTSKTFNGNNYNGDLTKIDNTKIAKINAIGDVSLTANGVKNVEILSGGKVTFNNATEYASLILYSKTVEFKDHINGTLSGSLIEIEDSAVFNKKLPMSNSTIQINNKFNSLNKIATFNEVEMSNESNIEVNGSASFANINYIKNSDILINGNAQIGYFQGFEHNPTIDIRGVLTITNANKSTLSTGTVIVDSIDYSDGAVNSNEAILVNGDGKLCIRDNTKLDILFGDTQKVKANSQGAIYVLDKSKDPNYEEMLKLKNKTTGSHDKLLGQNKFNELCGIGDTSTPITSDQYIMNDTKLTETAVKKDIIYK